MNSIEQFDFATETKKEVALEILERVGYFKRCTEHKDVFIVTGNLNLVDAVFEGYSHWREYVPSVFDSYKEMNAMLERVGKTPEYSSHRCPECDRFKS